MAQDDIYQSKKRWETWVENKINKEKILDKPNKEDKRRKYYCKNKGNLKYYKRLIRSFEVDDLSYIRRLRLRDLMNFLTYHISCDLKDVNGVDRDKIIIELRKVTSPSQLSRTQREVRRIGRILFDDENKPKFFSEFKIKTDISRQTARKDKLTYEEFDRILKYFSNDTTTKAYLSLAFESLARPQELLYTKLKNIEWYDNYAFVNITEHGKEGIKKLLSADSFPYLLQMFNSHQDRKNKEAYLFLNECGNQLTPFAIGKRLKLACKKLGINKPITPYSIKRFGVTFRRLQGEPDINIQRIAGWRSLKQLKTYDLSDQGDIFKIELAKRGLIKDEKLIKYQPKTKACEYCGELVGFAESICPKCKHIVDKNLIKERIEKDQELIEFFKGIKELKQTNPEVFNVIRDLGKQKGIIP